MRTKPTIVRYSHRSEPAPPVIRRHDRATTRRVPKAVGPWPEDFQVLFAPNASLSYSRAPCLAPSGAGSRAADRMGPSPHPEASRNGKRAGTAIRSRRRRSGGRYCGAGMTHRNTPRRYRCEALRPVLRPWEPHGIRIVARGAGTAGNGGWSGGRKAIPPIHKLS